MKKSFIISAIAFSGLLYNSANAQIRVRLGLNFSPRPVVYAPARVAIEQGPAYEEPVYNNDGDDYYYLPDVDAYYNVTDQCYVYFDGDNWISAAYLPGEYHDYDWRNARRFEVRAARPYMHADFYRSKYDGHEFNGWSRNSRENHFDGGYRGEDHRFDRGHEGGYQRPQYNRENDHRFDRGRDGGYQQPEYNRENDRRFDRGREGGYQQPQNNRENDHRFDRGREGGYQQPQNNRENDHRFERGQGGYSQPAQSNGGNDQRFNNGGQSGHGQSAQPNGGNGQQYNNHGGNGQPASNGGAHDRGNGGANENYSQSNPRGGLTAHRMGRF